MQVLYKVAASVPKLQFLVVGFSVWRESIDQPNTYSLSSAMELAELFVTDL